MHSAAGPGGSPRGSPLQTSMGSAAGHYWLPSLTRSVGRSKLRGGCRPRGAGLGRTLPLAFTLLVRPLPAGPANLPRSARGALSPPPAAAGWRFGEAVALAPGTEGLSPLCLVLCRALCLRGSEHPAVATFPRASSTKAGCLLPCLHIPGPGAPEARPPLPAWAKHQPPREHLFSE